MEYMALLTALREEENSPGTDPRHGFGRPIKPVGWVECGLSAHEAADLHVLPRRWAGSPWSYRYNQ